MILYLLCIHVRTLMTRRLEHRPWMVFQGVHSGGIKRAYVCTFSALYFNNLRYPDSSHRSPISADEFNIP